MLEQQDRLLAAVSEGFGDNHVLVVGDIMLDRYIWGDVDRISPEAPVPVVHFVRETEVVGAAGNVALNLVGLGLRVEIAGVVGEDPDGTRLRSLLESAGFNTDGVLIASDRPTTVKERVMGGHQQMLRIDREATRPLSGENESLLIEKSVRLIENGPAVVVLSDYDKGALTPTICQALISAARDAGIPVVVDPKGLDYKKYTGATALSPNRQELAEIAQLSPKDPDLVDGAGRQLRDELALQFLVVTLGEDGMELITEGGSERIPAVARSVFDVTGAGDTVIATLAAGMSAKLSAKESLTLAALAAGVVVGKVGTTAVTRAELLADLMHSRSSESADAFDTLPELLNKVRMWREDGAAIAFTNGCFDLLHAGHIAILEAARAEGDRLIVGLNSDHSTRRLKGEDRPIVPQEARARVIAALSSVDAVVIFDEDTPLDLINAIRPDVVVKGSDYSEQEVVGGAEVKSWGGRVVLVPLVGDFSTSDLIRRMDNH